jgi:hypothetical protein
MARVGSVSIDPTELAKFVADTLDVLERDEDLDETAKLVDAVLVVEIQMTTGEGKPVSNVHAYSLGGRNTASVGIVYRGLRAMTDPD